MSSSDERKHLREDNLNLPKLRRNDHISIDPKRRRSYASDDATHGSTSGAEKVNLGKSEHLRDGNREQNTEFRKSHHISIDVGRRSSAPRPYASTGNMRQGETLSATRSEKEVDLGKSERRLAKQPHEKSIPEVEDERSVDPQNSASRKGLLPGDPALRGSIRPNSARLPAGASVSHRCDNASQKMRKPAPTMDTTTSPRGLKNEVKTNAVAQDGTGLSSGIFGGIARALGMRPPTSNEVQLDKDNHKLKEEKKVLRTKYDNAEKVVRRYHHDAFRFHHENLRLQERLEALSLELKGITMRYEEAKSLSETRLKRLLAAQVFVKSEADSQSMSELIQKVESLDDDMRASKNAANWDAKAKIQDGADPRPNSKNVAATKASEVRTNALPEAGQGQGLRNHLDSEETLINPVSQDGADPDSSLLRGIADASRKRPPTAKEARLEKENHKLREENRLLLTEYNNLQMATRKYHQEARRFYDENKRLQESIEAMSLEVKDITKRYKEVKSLSETRLKRLLAAQVFLTLEGAGSPPMSELIQKVDALNGDEYLRSLLQSLE